ncbi:MAG: hypothetical protein JW852_07115 [Spirochaetales bacterium]|nr:hypothetical protein [Spirochaetales bacterium]
MKKRLILFLAALLHMSASLQADPSTAVWDSTYSRWDVAVSLSGGLSYAFRLAAYPSVDVIISSIKIDDFMPLDFGISARGLITNYKNPEDESGTGWLHLGVGLAATAHISFNNLRGHSLPYMENFDFYVACGPVYDFISFTGAYESAPPPIPSNGLGITTAGGVRYFILDWLAVNIEIFNWRFSQGVTAGLTFNF